jgi:hypothetical protein
MRVTIHELKRLAIFMVMPGQSRNAWPSLHDGFDLLRSKDGLQYRLTLQCLSELACGIRELASVAHLGAAKFLGDGDFRDGLEDGIAIAGVEDPRYRMPLAGQVLVYPFSRTGADAARQT